MPEIPMGVEYNIWKKGFSYESWDLHAKSKFCFNGTYTGFRDTMLLDTTSPTPNMITSDSFKRFVDDNQQQLIKELSPLQLQVLGLQKGFWY